MNSNNTNKTYNWKKEWIKPYESSWGIFEKFKYTNSLSSKDILSQLIIQGTSLFGKKHRNLYDLSLLDDELIEDILGFSIVTHQTRYGNELHQSLYKKKYMKFAHYNNDIWYCKNCIQEGFHGLFHQLKILDTCPLHAKTLTNACPGCGRIQNYSLSDEGWQAPYTCKCGHLLLGSFLYTNTIKYWDGYVTKISDKKVTKWIEENRSQHTAHSTYYWGEPSLDLFELSNGIILTKINQKPSTNSYRIRKDEFNQGDFNREVYFKTKATFKAVARHIRKSKLSNDTKTPYDSAYLYWRAFHEKIDILRVDNGRRLKKDSFDFQNIYSSHVNEIASHFTSYFDYIYCKEEKNLEALITRTLINFSTYYYYLSFKHILVNIDQIKYKNFTMNNHNFNLSSNIIVNKSDSYCLMFIEFEDYFRN